MIHVKSGVVISDVTVVLGSNPQEDQIPRIFWNFAMIPRNFFENFPIAWKFFLLELLEGFKRIYGNYWKNSYKITIVHFYKTISSFDVIYKPIPSGSLTFSISFVPL